MPINSEDSFLDLNEELTSFLKDLGDDADILLESMAKEFVCDLNKLARPKSRISKPTHLVNSFAYARNKRGNGYVVGWGVYYGKFVEYGHTTKNHKKNVEAKPHAMPLYNANSKKYYDHAIEKYFKNE